MKRVLNISIVPIVNILIVSLLLSSCNFVNQRPKDSPEVRTPASPADLANFDQKIDAASTDPKEWKQEKIYGLIESLMLQRHIILKDQDGNEGTLADFRSQPENYYILFRNHNKQQSYDSLHTKIIHNPDLANNQSEITLSFHLYRSDAEAAGFNLAAIETPAEIENLTLSLEPGQMEANLQSINETLQAMVEDQEVESKTYLVAAIVLASIASIAYINAHFVIGTISVTAAAIAGIFYWLRKPTEFEPPTILADNYVRPIDLDDEISRQCKSESGNVTEEQINAYNPMAANGWHRFYHLFWHSLRNAWHTLSDQDIKTVAAIDPQLGVHYPLHHSSFFERFNDHFDPFKNGAGEEFLLMHREMVKHIRGSLISKNLPCIAAWPHIPSPADPLSPVPQPGSTAIKSDITQDLMVILEAEYYHNQKWLRAHSLSAVGHSLEFSLHGLLHLRWTDETSPFRNRPYLNAAAIMSLGPEPVTPEADYLSDPFHAHVNPYFWKLHGYVDDVINRWLVAHDYDSVAINCAGKPRCYQWQIAKDAYMLQMPWSMALLPKVQNYIKSSPQAGEAVTALMAHIEPYRLQIATQESTDPAVIERVLKLADKLNIPAQDLIRVGDILLMP